MSVDLFNEVQFLLYTRENNINPEQLWIENELSLKISSFDSNKMVKFITHGWEGTSDGIICTKSRKAFLDENDCNVIVVDWSGVAKLPYLEAAARIKVIGGYIAKMINFLESQGSDPNHMSLVGHSLGAPLMGLAGNQTINKVGHIVAVDAAKSGFKSATPPAHLLQRDVRLNEVNKKIHKSKVRKLSGHVNYRSNGVVSGSDKRNTRALDDITSSMGMIDIQCPTYGIFFKPNWNNEAQLTVANSEGYRNIAQGLYFLQTNGRLPFGLGLCDRKTTACMA